MREHACFVPFFCVCVYLGNKKKGNYFFLFLLWLFGLIVSKSVSVTYTHTKWIVKRSLNRENTIVWHLCRNMDTSNSPTVQRGPYLIWGNGRFLCRNFYHKNLAWDKFFSHLAELFFTPVLHQIIQTIKNRLINWVAWYWTTGTLFTMGFPVSIRKYNHKRSFNNF